LRSSLCAGLWEICSLIKVPTKASRKRCKTSL
jgi:hypothetical protein